jgi:hypothetical protein
MNTMKKTLYIHIGHYKTGTTALQIFFGRNTEFLATHDIEYPRVHYHNAKHSAYAFAILRDAGVTKLMHGYNHPMPPDVMWTELFEHVRASPMSAVLISSEEFIRVGEFDQACEKLAEIAALAPDLDIRIIAYLRAPAPHLRSWYNQLVKMGFHVPDFATAIQTEIETIHSDYARALTPWCEAFGAENVNIRQYRSDPDNPNFLLQDFMSVLGVTLDGDAPSLGRDPNPRLDDRVIDLVRLMQNMEFPPGSIDTIRQQALKYLEFQDRFAAAHARDREALHAAAQAGVDWLAEAPNCNIDPGSFSGRLPDPDPQETTQSTLLLGFVFSELITLRQRVNTFRHAQMADKIKVLEARIDALEARPEARKDD